MNSRAAPGKPFAGAAVQVANDLFWIALSNVDDDVARNLQLLSDGLWFDMPLLFSDKTRGLTTFEMGTSEKRVTDAAPL